MNFGRILNVFIILFIMINIVLATIYAYKQNEKYTLSNDKEMLLREILGKNDINVYTLLPDYKPRGKVEVEGISINPEDYSETFFQGGSTLKPLEKRYIKGNEDIVISDSRISKIEYQKTGIQDIDKFNEDTVMKIGNELMKRLTLGKGSMVLTSNLPDDNNTSYKLIYNDMVRGDDVLFMSYIKITIHKNGNIEGKSERYKPTKFEGDKAKITPVDEVLYKFMYNMKLTENNESIYIKGIDIGYYKDEDNESGSPTGTQVAVPCYRIRLDNGVLYYIDAYTNEIYPNAID